VAFKNLLIFEKQVTLRNLRMTFKTFDTLKKPTPQISNTTTMGTIGNINK